MIIAIALICGMIFDITVLGTGFYTVIILHRSIWWFILAIFICMSSGLNIKYVLKSIRETHD